MNEPPDPRSRLLADLFPADGPEGGLAHFARAAARHARRRRSRQRLSGAGAAIAGAAAVLAVFFSRPDLRTVRSSTVEPGVRAASGLQSDGSRAASATGAEAARLASAARPAGYEIISDDELIADLHDRPLLVLGTKATGRKIVLLQP
jgi:hypothetical protein